MESDAIWKIYFQIYRGPGVIVSIGIWDGSDEPVSIVQQCGDFSISAVFGGQLKEEFSIFEYQFIKKIWNDREITSFIIKRHVAGATHSIIRMHNNQYK